MKVLFHPNTLRHVLKRSPFSVSKPGISTPCQGFGELGGALQAGDAIHQLVRHCRRLSWRAGNRLRKYIAHRDELGLVRFQRLEGSQGSFYGFGFRANLKALEEP